MECIVLAGGLGTRLQGVLGDMPKCMADVAGKPFLHHLFRYLAAQGCSRVILSLGYRHEKVIQWLGSNSWPFAIDTVIEQEPLGTGGGILLAAGIAREQNVFVINGDTMFRADLPAMLDEHLRHKAAATLALKMMYDFDRYGVVELDASGCIKAFGEKEPRAHGLINGGIYVLNKAALLEKALPAKCSFEKDYLERYVSEQCFCGYVSEAYFIDIGIPADYEKAQKDLAAEN